MPDQARLILAGPSLQSVQAAEDGEFLVKESAVLTGQAGRSCVIAGADCLAHRMNWHPIGLKVEQFDAEGRVFNTQRLRPPEFLGHSLIEDLLVGQFSPPPLGHVG